MLDEARRGTLPGMVRTGATFADAAAEWLRYIEQERGRKASTIRDYNSVVNVHLLPAFGQEPLEKIDAEMIEGWLSARLQEGKLSRRSLQKIVVLLNGIFKRARKVWKLTHDPMVDVERLTVPKRTDIEFYSPEEVHALVRAAADEQDAALFLTGALTGLRMGELLALRWRDIDFPAQTLRVTASYTNGKLGTPKSGLGRAVPLVDEVAQALARLGTRKRWAGSDDLVFGWPAFELGKSGEESLRVAVSRLWLAVGEGGWTPSTWKGSYDGESRESPSAPGVVQSVAWCGAGVSHGGSRPTRGAAGA